MKLCTITTAAIATALIAGTAAGATAEAVTSQPARGTFASQVSQGTAIYGNCAIRSTTTTAYFHWSATYGWLAYPAPQVSSAYVVTCHALKGQIPSSAAVAGYNPCIPGQYAGTCTVRYAN